MDKSLAKSAELARAFDAMAKGYEPEEVGTALCASLIVVARNNGMPLSMLLTVVIDSLLKGWDYVEEGDHEEAT